MNTSVSQVSSNGQLIDQSRTPDEIELETLNTHIALWLMSHPGCDDDLIAYQTMLDHAATFPVHGNDLTHLYVVVARDTFRSMYGHSWSERR